MTNLDTGRTPALDATEQPLLPGVPRLAGEERAHPLAGQLVAGIDVGSNAMRLKIARVTPSGSLIPVVDHREPVRLGSDAFRDRQISAKTLEETVAAFHRFRGLLDSFAVTHLRSVATSALREAENNLAIIDRLADETGITLEIISALEEAELVVRAVTRAVDDPVRDLMIVDVGGGSVEVSVVTHGRLAAIEGFSVGTVRMLQYLGEQTTDEREYPKFIQSHLAFMRNRVARLVREHPVQQVIAIGGNASSLPELAHVAVNGQGERVENRTDRLTRTELAEITELLDSLTVGQRVSLLGLAERRADVIQPAAYLYQTVLEASGVDELLIPGVGVRDGLLWQMVDLNLVPAGLASPKSQIYAMALDIAERYRSDLSHAEQVAWLAERLFDELSDLHRLTEQDRHLLIAAALLHDVGHLVNHGKHHLHTYYLIRNADFYGLSARDQELVALVARFHRKTEPQAERHPEFAALPFQDRVRVSKLAALLRVADALDRAHARVISALRATVQDNQVILHLDGPVDLNIERWAMQKNAGLFKRVFLADVRLEAQEATNL